jgi:hypothetical protein
MLSLDRAKINLISGFNPNIQKNILPERIKGLSRKINGHLGSGSPEKELVQGANIISLRIPRKTPGIFFYL